MTPTLSVTAGYRSWVLTSMFPSYGLPRYECLPVTLMRLREGLTNA